MDVELLETMAPTSTTRRGVAVAAPAKRKPPPPGASGELRIDGVWKSFGGGGNGGGKRACTLQDIHLTVKPGEFVVMVGPSGCGKSTLLNIAAGMLRPDAGGECQSALYLERLRDAIGCERSDEGASEAMIASVSVRFA